MSSDQSVPLRSKKKKQQTRRRKSIMQTAKSLFNNKKETPEEGGSGPLNSTIREIEIPHIDDEQRQELFRSTIEMIADANDKFERKSSEMHQQIFEIEEQCRHFLLVKEHLINNEKIDHIVFNPQVMPDAGCQTPIDYHSLTTVEAAQEFYEKLLVDQLEHQNVLDQIVVAKQERLRLILSDLSELGYQVSPRDLRKRAKEGGKENEDVKRLRSRSVSKTVREGIRRTSRALTISSSSANNSHHIAKMTTTPPPVEDPEPTVSELIISNKDLLNKKSHISSKGTITPDDFLTVSVIGQGAFGKVLLVVKKKTGQLMAMKIMKKSMILEDDDSLRHVIHELEFMRDLSHHPFIVSLYHAFQTSNQVSLVMEWVGGGSIFDWLVKRDTPFPEADARFYAAQVLLALQCLHSNNIVYRDLKLENILLDEDGYIRLSDFGLSARAKRGERIHSFSGTATYLAPEIINDTGDKGHTHCVDLWCFGVMLFIMLTQEPPFWAEHYPDLFHLIKSTEVPFHFYDHLSSNAISVLRGLLEKNPEKRLGCGPRGIAEVQEHPFFQSIDWKLLLAKKIPPPLKPTIYKGKPVEEEEEEEEEAESTTDIGNVPVDVFKGFSFVWNPNESEEKFLSESIDVLRSERKQSISSLQANPARGVKNRVIVNFFLWIKELQGLSSKLVDKSVYLRWKHVAKKYCTIIGDDDDRNNIEGQTNPVLCDKQRSVIFSGILDNACIACDYEMLQDRKTLLFDSRPIKFCLYEENGKKAIGKVTIELSDFSFHKLEKTMMFAIGNDTGCTLVLSILCSWKRFNGDLVDNYESHQKNLKHSNQK